MSSVISPAPQESIIRLHAADHLAFLRANHLLKQYGITIQQALILRYLSQHSAEHINQKNLELYLGISNPSVTSLMKTMVSKQLIRRLPDRSDARSYLLCLTDKGIGLQECISASFLQLAQEINAGLTSQEIEQLTYLLDKISRNLSAKAE